MKPYVEAELLTRWIPEMTTRGIQFVCRELETDSGLLIRGDFSDDEGAACLAEVFGRNHPAIQGEEPGLQFLSLIGLRGNISTIESLVVQEWDNNDDFGEQLLAALKCELFYREGGQSCPTKITKRANRSVSAGSFSSA